MSECRYWNDEIWICTVYGDGKCKGKKCKDYTVTEEDECDYSDWNSYKDREDKPK